MNKSFVDAHHHLWNLDKVDYKWLKRIGEMKPFGDPTPIQRNYEFSELSDVDAHGLPLIKSVHLQADPNIPDPVTETAYIQSEADKHGHDIAIVGFVDLTKPNAEDTMQRHLEYPSFRGVRQIVCKTTKRPELCFVQTDLMNDPTWRVNFGLLEKYELSFDFQLYPEQMQTAADLVAQHPLIPIAINHAGCPFDLSDDGINYWAKELGKLAAHDHVSLKFSGLGMYDKDWNGKSGKKLFDICLDQFGAERIMLGSNFPVDKLMRSYSSIWNDYQTWISELDSDAQTAIRRGNAEAFYRF